MNPSPPDVCRSLPLICSCYPPMRQSRQDICHPNLPRFPVIPPIAGGVIRSLGPALLPCALVQLDDRKLSRLANDAWHSHPTRWVQPLTMRLAAVVAAQRSSMLAKLDLGLQPGRLRSALVYLVTQIPQAWFKFRLTRGKDVLHPSPPRCDWNHHPLEWSAMGPIEEGKMQVPTACPFASHESYYS